MKKKKKIEWDNKSEKSLKTGKEKDTGKGVPRKGQGEN